MMKPSQLPEWRGRIMDAINIAAIKQAFDGDITDLKALSVIRAMHSAPMYYLGTDAAEVALAGAMVMPENSTAERHDFISPSGFVYSGPLKDHDLDRAPYLFSISGWLVMDDRFMEFLIFNGTGAPELVCFACAHRFSASIEGHTGVLATNLLMMQPGIMTTTDAPLRPKDIRRHKRNGTDYSPVRVIDLRHSHGGHGHSGRHLTKRFLVRGHWRNQPCGVGRSQRRMIWIAPHIKGPDGAPLDTRPTVWKI